MATVPALSIVTTMYRSSPYLHEFYRRACAVAEESGATFEIILVNDGSPDDSLDVAVELYARDHRVRIVDLSRNFGHHKAMMTGLAHARGELVFLIDCDLETGPEVLPQFVAEMRRQKVDVVYGVQEARQNGMLDRVAGEMFYTVFNKLSTYKLPPNLLTTRVMTRRYVNALLEHREREVVIGGLWAITGFRQASLPVAKGWKGSTTYNLTRRVSLLVNAITSFSDKPLILIFYLGCLVSFLGALGAIALIVRVAFFGGLLAGWASVIVSLWLLGGLIMLCLGTIGIYLSKIFIETKQRPYTIVRTLYERDERERTASS